MQQMTLKEIIEKRQHKFDGEYPYCHSEGWKRYMTGWYWAYQDLFEILEQHGFDMNQVVVKGDE